MRTPRPRVAARSLGHAASPASVAFTASGLRFPRSLSERRQGRVADLALLQLPVLVDRPHVDGAVAVLVLVALLQARLAGDLLVGLEGVGLAVAVRVALDAGHLRPAAHDLEVRPGVHAPVVIEVLLGARDLPILVVDDAVDLAVRVPVVTLLDEHAALVEVERVANAVGVAIDLSP